MTVVVHCAYERYASLTSVDEARIPLQPNDPLRNLEIELGRAVVECSSHNSDDGAAIIVTAPMVLQLSFAYTAPSPPPSAVRPRTALEQPCLFTRERRACCFASVSLLEMQQRHQIH